MDKELSHISSQLEKLAIDFRDESVINEILKNIISLIQDERADDNKVANWIKSKYPDVDKNQITFFLNKAKGLINTNQWQKLFIEPNMGGTQPQSNYELFKLPVVQTKLNTIFNLFKNYQNSKNKQQDLQNINTLLDQFQQVAKNMEYSLKSGG